MNLINSNANSKVILTMLECRVNSKGYIFHIVTRILYTQKYCM